MFIRNRDTSNDGPDGRSYSPWLLVPIGIALALIGLVMIRIDPTSYTSSRTGTCLLFVAGPGCVILAVVLAIRRERLTK